jgi:hypothetical protein
MSEPGPSEADIRRGHEVSDVSGHGFLIFTILFLSCLGTISLSLIGLLGYLSAGVSREPASAVAGRLLPGEPRIQGSFVHPDMPNADMARLRQDEEKMLTSYGWVDRPAGIARIPVARAMELFLQRGPPAPTSRPEGFPVIPPGTPLTEVRSVIEGRRP